MYKSSLDENTGHIGNRLWGKNSICGLIILYLLLGLREWQYAAIEIQRTKDDFNVM
jgi:hypothetical protein